MGFSKQEYWSGLPFLSSRDLPDPGMEPRSPALQENSLPSEPPGKHHLVQKAFSNHPVENTSLSSFDFLGFFSLMAPEEMFVYLFIFYLPTGT